MRRRLLLNKSKQRNQNFKIDPKWLLIAIVLILSGFFLLARRVLVQSTSIQPDQGTTLGGHLSVHTVASGGSTGIGKAEPAATVHSNGPLYFTPNQQKATFISPLDPSLPKWIRDYITWHRQVRAQYPGAELFNNPQAPNVLIRTCLGLCGGLHDRLGQLAWDLYLANQTKRVLFVRWYRPKPIEDFLIPNYFNWSMPPNIPGFSRLQEVKHTITELFEGVDDAHPEEDFWTTHLQKGIERAKNGDFKAVKILRHRILGHLNEDELEKRLVALGETDMIHDTLSFGKLFFLFFHPAPAVEMELEDVYETLKIAPGKYSAVHCRVRHPKAFSKGAVVKGKHKEYPADKTGLPWEGQTREFAVETATDALHCAKDLLKEPKEPIYFFSDSNDLVRYFSRELQNSTFVSTNRTLLKSSTVDWTALQEVQNSNVVARNVDLENTHIDRQKGRAPPAYYGTFVDLFLAINARCVTFGIGYYAVFAAKISGIKCKQVYTEEAWGGNERKRLLADVCKQKKR
ncbi:expressed unknown protein [Seminavis robusta]|uniref:Uncharacterized protein n=1 Tax=Seminavis robusta TaxID=568900 RepID=A0A9N8H3W1_9STRA|nr:expressed unknown protein [Seminavis robusta]|eukprot:Sro47_g027870.1 n/a (515) ;mRNA; r:88886-90643